MTAVVYHDYKKSFSEAPSTARSNGSQCQVPLTLQPAKAAYRLPSAPYVTLSFASAGLTATFQAQDPNLITEYALNYNTAIRVSVQRTASPRYIPEHEAALAVLRSGQRPVIVRAALTVTIDPNGACEYIFVDHPSFAGKRPCKGKPPEECKVDATWCGSVTIDYSDLETALEGDTAFAVSVEYIAWFNATPFTRDDRIYAGVPNAINVGSSDYGKLAYQSSFLFIRTADDAATQGYVAVGGDFGHNPDLPPHRVAASLWAPLSPYDLFAASFSDDAGSVLQIRDTAAAAIVDSDTAKQYKCVSCGTFQQNDTEAFAPPLISTDVLGVDLSALGVDNPPFQFKAATFPIDAGYKFAESRDNGAIGVATFSGTTKKNGQAHDTVVQALRAFDGPGYRWQASVYGADTNRSLATLSTGGAYPAPNPVVGHTSNLQLSTAFMTEPTTAETLDATLSFAALVRYGTQGVPRSQTLDLAVSSLLTPAVLDLYRFQGLKTRPSLAMGYRDVGPAYAPNDAPFDQHAGMHGLYGVFDVTHPRCNYSPAAIVACGHKTKLVDVQVAAFRFGDSVGARDSSVRLKAAYPFNDFFGVTASWTSATISILEVGRANNISVSDAQGGTQMLPNGQYSGSFNYVANTGSLKRFEAMLGYSQSFVQNCLATAVTSPPPCFAYRTAQATGGIFWLPFRSYSKIFVTASTQTTANQALNTVALSLKASSANLFSETTGQIARFAGVGSRVLNDCSSAFLAVTNRGGDPDAYSKTPPVPGITESASIEFVPSDATWTPALFVAYNRIINVHPTSTTPNATSLLVRVQFGVPFRFRPQGYAHALCPGKG